MPQLQQNEKPLRPEQQQENQPGVESVMMPKPESHPRLSAAAPKLRGKVALITGGDSGIGRAVALAFATEGAHVALAYLSEDSDASDTLEELRSKGCNAIRLSGDIGDQATCQDLVGQVVDHYGGIDILVNNAAEQHPQEKFEDITAGQLERTFRTNIFAMFYLTQAALPHMKGGSAIINTASVTAYRGSSSLVDYSSTKGAIVSFTRSLAHALVDRGIRVNAVAPGPIWTPLIPSTFDADKVATFGSDVPLGRAGEPNEVAPCYVFLASHADSSYMTGQVLHPNGGEIVNG
jgi:NAD(P)-dependent dehydrogenase (short-subunit alcohol dehydrogenase family)